MKLIGIGTDIVNVKRLTKSIKKNKKFLKRVFSKKRNKILFKKKTKFNCFAKDLLQKSHFLKPWV